MPLPNIGALPWRSCQGAVSSRTCAISISRRSYRWVSCIAEIPDACLMHTAFPHIIILLTGLLFLPVIAQPMWAQPDYSGYDNLLRTYVRPDGRVDYNGLKSKLSALRETCQSMTRHHPDDAWTRAEAMTFWINVYNASTLLLVAEHYPIASILELDNGKTWQIPRVRVGDRTYTLDQIEKDIL